MEETGVINVADPLGGSWYVEALTDRMEAEAERIFTRIRDLAALAVPSGRHPIGEMTSGILRGIEDGYFTGEIADAAFAYTIAVEKGEKKVVGVNTLTGGVGDDLEILRISGDVETAAERAAGAPPGRSGRCGGPGRRWIAWSPRHGARRTWCRRCSTRCGPRRPSGRSATRCAPSGGSTPNRPASDRSASRAFPRSGHMTKSTAPIGWFGPPAYRRPAGRAPVRP